MVTKSRPTIPFRARSTQSKPQSWQPHPYQKKAVKFLLENSAAALLLDPGLGKTSITLAACKTLKNKGAFKGALIIAPLRPVYSVWPKEIEKWPEFNGFSVGILHDSKKDEVLEEHHDVFVMNYEGIDWLFGSPPPTKPKVNGLSKEDANKRLAAFSVEQLAWKTENARVKARLKLLFSKVDTLVFDELSKMKKPDTNRFKAIKPFLGKFARRWGLTGSPAPNGLMDLFGQAYVLDLGRALGQYITHYRSMYFTPSGYGGYDWKLQDGADEKIYAAMRPLSLRMQAEDYLDMPKIANVTIEVELPPAARKMYDDMEDELFTELEGTEFVAVNSASASTKCCQIAQGALYKDRVDPLTGIPVTGKREHKDIHKAKLVAVQELMDELQGQPLLGGYHFGHDLDRIVKHFGKDTQHLDVSPVKFEELRTQWNNNELTSLWGHPASMGHGNNMQEGGACHIVWFNIPWDYELYDQMIRRIRRQGNKAKVIYVYHIVCKGTIDELKMVTLHNKNVTQKSFLDAVKSYRSTRNGLSRSS